MHEMQGWSCSTRRQPVTRGAHIPLAAGSARAELQPGSPATCKRCTWSWGIRRQPCTRGARIPLARCRSGAAAWRPTGHSASQPLMLVRAHGTTPGASTWHSTAGGCAQRSAPGADTWHSAVGGCAQCSAFGGGARCDATGGWFNTGSQVQQSSFPPFPLKG
jgi:hypothetical protein